MPLTLNVGLSRKTSENYNSAGLSINLTAELDQSLLARPDELQGAISELYEQAEIALDQQTNPNPRPRNDDRSSNGHSTANGRTNTPCRSTSNRSNNGSRNPGSMTQSQRRAINAIGQRLDLNVAEESSHEFGLELDRMTVREASKFIDHLKSLQTANNGSSH